MYGQFLSAAVLFSVSQIKAKGYIVLNFEGTRRMCVWGGGGGDGHGLGRGTSRGVGGSGEDQKAILIALRKMKNETPNGMVKLFSWQLVIY